MTEEEFKKLFGEFMEIPADVDWAAVRYQEVEGWDSIAHMALIGEMEDRFGVMLETDDVIDMSSYEKAKEILSKYGQTIGG